ncbi:hypothetical protein EXN66_Car005383 [Channa argus]|uniref:Uncharacterized protein n=1 Tax=Channa argus TaxID=215402 RepID=A0A6G1PHB0_CHAAH|nr:hypothetical protein EXN66_Car005383 [Channa argus]
MVSSRIKAGSHVTGQYQDLEQEGLYRSTPTGQSKTYQPLLPLISLLFWSIKLSSTRTETESGQHLNEQQGNMKEGF